MLALRHPRSSGERRNRSPITLNLHLITFFFRSINHPVQSSVFSLIFTFRSARPVPSRRVPPLRPLHSALFAAGRWRWRVGVLLCSVLIAAPLRLRSGSALRRCRRHPEESQIRCRPAPASFASQKWQQLSDVSLSLSFSFSFSFSFSRCVAFLASSDRGQTEMNVPH